MKTLIVDDHAVVRKGLITLLKTHVRPELTFDEAQNGIEALDKLRNDRFGLVLLDVSMPGMNGWEVCKHIRSQYPNTAVIIISQYSVQDTIGQFMKMGVCAYLTKGGNLEEIPMAVECAREGKPFVCSGQKEKLPDTYKPTKLTRQEQVLIKLMMKGYTSKQMAEEMFLTVRTVETYRERLLCKTGTNNVAQLISYCYEAGLLP